MRCLICTRVIATGKLCNKCDELYIYDYTIKMIRMKKARVPSSNHNCMESASELRLYNILCLLYTKNKVFRHVHPLWSVGNKGALLEYDVAVPSLGVLIEYDGIQHFKFPNPFHKTKKEFRELRKRDRLKTKLAKINKFKVLRFNITHNIDKINVKKAIDRIL